MPEVPPVPAYDSEEQRAARAADPVSSPLWAPPDQPEQPAPLPPRRGPFDDLFSERPELGPFGAPAPGPASLGQGGMRRFPLPDLAFGAGGIAAGEAVVAAPPMPRRGIALPAGRFLREIAETVILALVIFLLVRSVVQNFQVEGKSMEPSLETGWYVLVNKAVYWEVDLRIVHKFLPFVHPGSDPTRYIFGGPSRGDVVVFKAPNQAAGSTERDFIKRVIGLPGDTVEVRSCVVYVNGKPVNEPYIAEPTLNSYGPQTVPKDQYFVMGDNRNNSSDSRSWGMLPKKNLIGKAWLIYWPYHDFGLVRTEAPKPADNATVPGKTAPACASTS